MGMGGRKRVDLPVEVTEKRRVTRPCALHRSGRAATRSRAIPVQFKIERLMTRWKCFLPFVHAQSVGRPACIGTRMARLLVAARPRRPERDGGATQISLKSRQSKRLPPS